MLKRLISRSFVFLCVSVCFMAHTVSAFQPFKTNELKSSNANMDFCVTGKFFVFTGNCTLARSSKHKDAISEKACADVNGVLSAGLSNLYPNAKIVQVANLSPDAIAARLLRPSLLGVFLVGKGDTGGGFVTGPKDEVMYPKPEYCFTKYNIFGGFFSHSKFAPDATAPASMRGLLLSRTEFVIDGATGIKGSWPVLCKPQLSLVYPTRTFAGRMKNDALSLINELQNQKKMQIEHELENICALCDKYVESRHPLAKLCPPYSDTCKVKRIMPGSEAFLLENYCLASHPELMSPSAAATGATR